MKPRDLHDIEIDIILVRTTTLTRAERLARWALLLERHDARIRTLDSIELVPRRRRNGMRAEDSALSIAFADPVLRDAGLEGETYGDVRAFFDLSHGDMHHLACRCHLGVAEQSRLTAARLRRMSAGPIARARDFMERLGRTFSPA